jgi:beta-lactam-binding protein with PASTA domain
VLNRHPVMALLASVVTAAGVAAGVSYVLTSRRNGRGAGSQMPMVIGLAVPDAETTIRSATGASRFDVEHVPGPAPEGRVVGQRPAAGTLVSRSARVRLMAAAGASNPGPQRE